jgi:hypothetical protein
MAKKDPHIPTLDLWEVMREQLSQGQPSFGDAAFLNEQLDKLTGVKHTDSPTEIQPGEAQTVTEVESTAHDTSDEQSENIEVPPPSVASLIQEAVEPEIPQLLQGPIEMDATALVFLNHQLARQLAVAWQTCKGDESKWLECAGIERNLFADANRFCSALKMNYICRPGGVTDKLAIKYITQILVDPILKRGRQNDKSKR